VVLSSRWFVDYLSVLVASFVRQDREAHGFVFGVGLRRSFCLFWIVASVFWRMERRRGSSFFFGAGYRPGSGEVGNPHLDFLFSPPRSASFLYPE